MSQAIYIYVSNYPWLQALTTANEVILEINGLDHQLRANEVLPGLIKLDPRYSISYIPVPRSDGLRAAFVEDMRKHGEGIASKKQELEARPPDIET